MLSQFPARRCNSLRGRRVLVIEDEMLVAMLIEDNLLSAGASTLGPKATLEDALQAVRDPGMGMLDAAVLDLNLNGAMSWPVAEVLIERGIPFVIATGYCDGRTMAGCNAPVLLKPFDGAALVKALADLLQPTSIGIGAIRRPGQALAFLRDGDASLCR